MGHDWDELARRASRRRGARFIVHWAAIRAVVCGVVAAATGEYELCGMAWAALTYFHIERVTGDWR